MAAANSTIFVENPQMKTVIALCTFFVLTPAFSQQWNENLDDALIQANSENRKVLLLFTVPDACDACAALERDVLQSDEFLAYASNYVLARIDFQHGQHPVPSAAKAKNLLIVEKYNKDGFFPLMVILDKNARVLGSRGAYDGESAAAYIASLRNID